jgi:hypothetical protein
VSSAYVNKFEDGDIGNGLGAISNIRFDNLLSRGSMQRMKRELAIGSPCFTPFSRLIALVRDSAH